MQISVQAFAHLLQSVSFNFCIKWSHQKPEERKEQQREREREKPVPASPVQRQTFPSVVHLGIEASQSKGGQHPSVQCEPAKNTISLTQR